MAKVHFWKARDGWRWRFIARNGRIIAEGGEAYTSKWNAERGFDLVFTLIASGKFMSWGRA